MPPTAGDRFRDILEAIAEIESFLGSRTLAEFERDRLVRLAVERSLEVVCEAARHLPDEVKREAPQIAWRRMTDLGNRLRHAYRETDVAVLWDILHAHLPVLKEFVERRIAQERR
jgi:uncharacterized protein with HEPN domain